MLQLNNPFIFAPIKLGYSDGSGKVTDRHKYFYAARNADIGAITAEPLYMHKSLRELPTQMGIDDDDKIPGLKQLNEIIHENSAKSIAHLNHPGRMANPKIPGNVWLSSTGRACKNGGAVPKAMTKQDIQDSIDLFADSSKRAKKAGFDIIELQFGHGYLVAQFLSPFVNDRTDEYGGSADNRQRLALDILDAVKKAVDLPVIIRISGDEMIPEGFHLDDMFRFSHALESHGADAVHVTAGTACSTPAWFFQHMFIPKGKTWEFADAIKSKINIPVIYVGRINSIGDINTLKEKHRAEYIALGRALIADPDFTSKYYGNKAGIIRPCLACSEGCLGGVKSGEGLQCLVNPETGKEKEKLQHAKQPKHIAVIGGGLAGMEAALTLNKKGHNVDLYEKNELGGQFNLAPLTPHKKSMATLVPYYKQALERENINIIFSEADSSVIVPNYDETILATGSKPTVPDIPGLTNYHWADILKEENLPRNKKVLIIGGGLIGVDIATALIPLHNQIIIVKRTTGFGEDMEMIAKSLSLKMMEEQNTIFSDHTHIKNIEKNTVYAERNGKDVQFDNIDMIVVSTGMKSYNPLEEQLKGKIPVHTIGDAKKIGNAQDAIRDGFETAKTI
ncbi:MAG: NAD(P)/FAD-dependent oxidoreductase [Bacteroidales bacterium]